MSRTCFPSHFKIQDALRCFQQKKKMILDVIIGYARNLYMAYIRLSQMDFIFCVAAPYIATVVIS